MRVISHRALRERLLAQKKMGGPPASEGSE
jgi:hypothetical protein